MATDASGYDTAADPGSPPIGVLVMAYGTPASPDHVEEYYTHIRRGRPPTADQLADLTRRYDAIGGVSPMSERTDAQVDSIRQSLDSTGDRFVVTLGQKHAAPFIEDAIESLVNAGAQVIVGVVLAPHYSVASVGQYHERAVEAIGGRVEYRQIDDWSTELAFIDFTATSLRKQLGEMPAETEVIFTAHSLPERALAGDVYRERLAESAAEIAATAGVRTGWRLGWQSAGRTPEPWAGPDILELIDGLAAESPRRTRGIVVVPQGFTSDHLEILYDLDIEAHSAAAAHGLAFARTDSINADPAVMGALAALIEQATR